MKTKGLFKKDFEKWFEETQEIDIQDLSYFSEKIDYHTHAPDNMQFGVYLDFFDQFGVCISVSKSNIYPESPWHYHFVWGMKINGQGWKYPSRAKAMEMGLKEAITLYNKPD